jgi:hypothetical protein
MGQTGCVLAREVPVDAIPGILGPGASWLLPLDRFRNEVCFTDYYIEVTQHSK